MSLSATFRLPNLILRFWSRYAILTAIMVQTMQIETKIPWTIQYHAAHFLIPKIESTFFEPMARFIKISEASKMKQRPCFAH